MNPPLWPQAGTTAAEFVGAEFRPVRRATLAGFLLGKTGAVPEKHSATPNNAQQRPTTTQVVDIYWIFALHSKNLTLAVYTRKPNNNQRQPKKTVGFQKPTVHAIKKPTPRRPQAERKDPDIGDSCVISGRAIEDARLRPSKTASGGFYTQSGSRRRSPNAGLTGIP